MASHEDEIKKLVSTIQMLKNRDLVSICQVNNLPKSGNKADLHRRIINYIDVCSHSSDERSFHHVKSSIMLVANGTLSSNRGPRPFSTSLTSSPAYDSVQSRTTSPYQDMSNGFGLSRAQNFLHQGLQFKPSPYYEIESPIGDVHQCEAMAQHRNSITVVIRAAQHPDLQKCLDDPAMRVMVFCAANNYDVQDIAFPYQCEIKVNGGEIKANLRGLKNKPGSTRPVDITSFLRLKPPGYGNSLEFTYALTVKRFYLALYICKTFSAATLASKIEKRSRITKESVIREVTKQAQDPDIVATSLVLSLKCPLTYMRLSLPVRASTCKHIQCFDATSYLQLQEQGPQWLCPICSKSAPYEALAVDEYVKDILEKTPTELDQVAIDPDGTWHTEKTQDHTNGVSASKCTPPRASGGSETVATLLDDEFEITSTPVPKRENGYSNGIASNGNFASSATLVNSRDATLTPSQTVMASGGGLNSNHKRPREVIDLTLSSDDDDDSPPRRLKRQHTSNGHNDSIPPIFFSDTPGNAVYF
ncbi:E3 SUMO-protein ligase pli1 [Sporothrix epigloea]|uniref:E3 SUMO-protein ligase pli1 n=1 Tax=Sporothrix epigloea TaxID=1892477 RepID=A0ABP0D9X2_9PEZI